MQARDVMTRNVVSVMPDTPVDEIATPLLVHRISGLWPTTIRRDAGVRDRSLHIAVSGGIVHVCGVDRSEEERNVVRAAAQSTPGVRAVEDYLCVLSPEMFFGS